MRALLQTIFLFSILTLSCSNYSSEQELCFQDILKFQTLCPIDTCQKTTIELSLQGLNYSAPFTCYKWTDWGTGLEVDWTDGGRILFFTFPNHRICNSEYRICAEDICDCNLLAEKEGWLPIEGCPRNNTLTISLDSCLFGQATLFLDLYLIENE